MLDDPFRLGVALLRGREDLFIKLTPGKRAALHHHCTIIVQFRNLRVGSLSLVLPILGRHVDLAVDSASRCACQRHCLCPHLNKSLRSL